MRSCGHRIDIRTHFVRTNLAFGEVADGQDSGGRDRTCAVRHMADVRLGKIKMLCQTLTNLAPFLARVLVDPVPKVHVMEDT